MKIFEIALEKFIFVLIFCKILYLKKLRLKNFICIGTRKEKSNITQRVPISLEFSVHLVF